MTARSFTSLILSALCCIHLSSFAQSPTAPATKAQKTKTKTTIKLVPNPPTAREIVYKTTPQGELKLHIYAPAAAADKSAPRPCVVFFFGGGWKSGSFLQFVPQAEYLATRGIVGICADYRIFNEHKTLPDKAVEDARSAMRWVRSHAAELGVDPTRIAAAGGSAGGHLAACTAFVTTLDHPAEDTSISPVPNALIMFNPAMNISTLYKNRITPKPEGFTLALAEAITPNAFVHDKAPPAILFFGTADDLKIGADEYIKKARALGCRAEMWTAADMPHGFFNKQPWLEVTTQRMEAFLTSLEWLKGKSTLQLPTSAPTLATE